MKLLVKTSRYFLALGIPFFLVAGVASYFIMTTEVKRSNYELLRKRKAEIEKIITSGDTVFVRIIEQSGEAIVDAVPDDYFLKEQLSDTLIYDADEKELAPNAMLTETIKTKDGNYLLKVWRSTLEFEELLGGIITGLIIILVFFFGVFIYINWWVSKKLWLPFYQTLEGLQEFRPNSGQPAKMPESSVKEFHDLTVVVNQMMHKMIADFNGQKQFTENASHELQTPLAIIKTKIDLLIQFENLGEAETDLITSIDQAVTRLSKLNKALLLLTKIENRQFVSDSNVSLNKIMDDSLELFSEHISGKQITVVKRMQEEVRLNINPDLCAILVNNLLQNAIRHSEENESIKIILDRNHFSISNKGSQSLDATKIFNRFQKKSASPESLGLGLAIAKEIADASNLKLTYQYDDNNHFFIIWF